MAAESDDGGAPASYEEALRGDEAEGWKKAFAAEVQSLNDNKVSTVVDIFGNLRSSGAVAHPALIVNDKVNEFQDTVVVDLAGPNWLKTVDKEIHGKFMRWSSTSG